MDIKHGFSKLNVKKQYVYIGQYYHIKNKELPLDFKFGVTEHFGEDIYHSNL